MQAGTGTQRHAYALGVAKGRPSKFSREPWTSDIEGWDVTPEFVYDRWCEAVRLRGNPVREHWFTLAGKDEFVSKAEVVELAKFPAWVIVDALSKFPKIRDVVVNARQQFEALDKAQRIAMRARLPSVSKSSPSQTGRPPTSPKPESTKPPRPAKKPTQASRPLSNTDPYFSASRGHQPHSRVTPTFSKALCPACGLIEDGCPCSR